MPLMHGLNGFLLNALYALGLSTVFLLIVRFLPDFARNLTILIASVAAIEIFTSPFFTFGLIAVTGLVYYGLFWLQWNPRKAFFCRLISLGLAFLLLALLVFIPLAGVSVICLASRLLWVAHGVGKGRPLPSDPLEFFVYAFFFPSFFLGPVERLESFRNNLTNEHRPALSWKETGLRLCRIAFGLLKIWVVMKFLPSRGFAGIPGVILGLSGLYDLILGGTGLAGYRFSPTLDGFPLGTLISRRFLLHAAAAIGVMLAIFR